MFDILGFRAMLDELGLQSLMERIHDLRSVLDRLLRWEARFVTFSDTILLYSKPIPEPLNEAHELLIRHDAEGFFRYAGMLQVHALMAGLPLRGAIALGECVVVPTRGVFVGPPIVDAYLLSEAQDWIGVAVHGSCAPMVTKFEPPEKGVVVRSQVPIKGQPDQEGWTLDWPRMTWTSIELRDKLDVLVAESVGTPHLRRWERTMDFVERRVAILERPWTDRGPEMLPVCHRER